jgi:hypothetical protein
MAHIFITGKAGASFGWDGNVYHSPPVTADPPTSTTDGLFEEVSLPTDTYGMDEHTSFAIYTGNGTTRCYMVGGFTLNVALTEDYALVNQGILAPPNELVNVAGTGQKIGVVASAASGTGLSGEVIVYLSLWDAVHGRRSPLSGGSPIITMSGQAFTIDNLPSSVEDGSATHWEVWHSVDGALPALAVRRQIGASSIVEEVPNLSLGEVFDRSFERMPRGRYNAIYHDRQVIAGVDKHPDRLYLSAIGFPERSEGLWLRTRKGEPITALAAIRDVLLVFTPTSTYAVQGYTAADIEMNVIEPHIGCINHFGIVNVHGLLIIPSHLGFYVSTGMSFHFISDEFQDTWKVEYEANEVTYESTAFGAHDAEGKVYKFYVGAISAVDYVKPTATLYAYWVLDYETLIREVGGNFSPPRLSFDVRQRADQSAAMLATPGSARGYFYTGSADGEIRRENDNTDLDDDGDTFDKKLHIQTKHYFWGSPGGGENEGWFYPNFWLFCTHEVSSGTTSELNLMVGDEDAWRSVRDYNASVGGQYRELIPGGLSQVDDGNPEDLQTMWNRTVWSCTPMVAGRGMTVMWSVDNADARVTRWDGFGGTRRPGVNYRGRRQLLEDQGSEGGTSKS